MLSYMVPKNKVWTLIFKQTNYKISKKFSSFVMSEKYNVRWAFNAREWKPTECQILAASTYIQEEEKTRIAKYVFQDDAKSSLIGRLMLRKYVHMSTSIPYDEIRFGRDDRGKPYLLNAGDTTVHFNVSHQGDFVVLAGNTEVSVGIDVMKIEPPVNKNIPEFFRLMNRQFSPQEWSTIRKFTLENEQIACFYRLWCLKESYVKNIGVGITIPLVDISFSLNTHKLKVNEVVSDTNLYVSNILKNDWVFEESLLDSRHAVAVALPVRRSEHIASSYQCLTFEDFTKEAKPFCQPDHEFSRSFMKKTLKDL